MDATVTETPKILENLVAAGLVSHELIGDPARLGTESAALAALCARIAGPVYRLGAFHYAFRAAETDLSGELAALEPARWGAAIEASLTAELGEEAVWISAADLALEAEAAIEDRAILFLKAGHGAVAAALSEAPDLAAIIAAGTAARSAETAAALAAEAIRAAADEARRAAGADAAAVAVALDGLGARHAALEGALAALRAEASETIGLAVTEAASAAIADAVPPAVERAVETAVEIAVRRAVADAVADAVARAVAEAVAGEVETALSAAMARMTSTMTETMTSAVANVARMPDPTFERAVGAMEAIVGRLSEQAARTAEEAARGDALASGIAALESSLEALTAATIARAADETARETERAAEWAAEREAEREAEHAAGLAAFENRLGLTLAEFLARIAPARIVETGRPAAPAPLAAEEAPVFDPLPVRMAQG